MGSEVTQRPLRKLNGPHATTRHPWAHTSSTWLLGGAPPGSGGCRDPSLGPAATHRHTRVRAELEWGVTASGTVDGRLEELINSAFGGKASSLSDSVCENNMKDSHTPTVFLKSVAEHVAHGGRVCQQKLTAEHSSKQQPDAEQGTTSVTTFCMRFHDHQHHQCALVIGSASHWHV